MRLSFCFDVWCVFYVFYYSELVSYIITELKILLSDRRTQPWRRSYFCNTNNAAKRLKCWSVFIIDMAMHVLSTHVRVCLCVRMCVRTPKHTLAHIHTDLIAFTIRMHAYGLNLIHFQQSQLATCPKYHWFERFQSFWITPSLQKMYTAIWTCISTLLSHTQVAYFPGFDISRGYNCHG